jgi:hypothetical protein
VRVAALAAGALLAAAAVAAGDADLLPASGSPPGWTRAGEARAFTGSDLYNHIDGGAEIFLEFGFEAATVQRYTRGGEEVVVECYRMDDPDAALGVYLGKCGSETPAPGLAERHTAGRYQLLMVRDRYVVIVGNGTGSASAAAALVEFARAIAARLPAARPANALGVLPTPRLIAGSQRIIRGPVALSALVTLGDGDILRLGGKVSAVAGSYDGDGDRTALIIADYPDAAAAEAAFSNVAGRLDRELVPVARTEARLVFRDRDGRFGLIDRSGARLSITLGLAKDPTPP